MVGSEDRKIDLRTSHMTDGFVPSGSVDGGSVSGLSSPREMDRDEDGAAAVAGHRGGSTDVSSGGAVGSRTMRSRTQPLDDGIVVASPAEEVRLNRGYEAERGRMGSDGDGGGGVTGGLKEVVVPEQFKGSTNSELISWLEDRVKGWKPKSEEELRRLRKRQAARKMVAGISDVGRAISNLVATSQYAPNAYTDRDSMSDRMQARYDREKAERDAENDRYMNYALMLGRLRDQDKNSGLNIWKMERDLARQAQQDGWAAADREWLAKTRGWAEQDRPIEVSAKKANAEAAGYNRDVAKKKAEYASKMMEADINKKNRTGSGRGGGGRSGGSGGYTWLATDKDGNVHSFSARSRDQAYSYAGAMGWTITSYVEEVHTQGNPERSRRGKVQTRRRYGSDGKISKGAWDE